MTLDQAKIERRNVAESLAKKHLGAAVDAENTEAGFKQKLEKQKMMDQQTLFREKEVDNLQALIYGEGNDNQEGPLLEIDTFRYDSNPAKLDRYKSRGFKRLLKKKFVTGQSKDKILENLLNMSDSDNEAETKEGTKLDKDQLRRIEENDRKGSKADKKKKRLENKGIKVEDDSDDNSEDIDEGSGDEDELLKVKKKKEDKPEEMADRKPAQKTQEELKKSLFLGEKYGHYKIGTYVQIEIQVEKKFSRMLEPDYPIVLCSLKHQETGYAYVRVKIKKHRWYPHILKSKDPLTFSMGWRKYQSIPVYTQQGDAEDDRIRMIKYTPKFGHCYAVFYAPTCSVGTTFVGVQKIYETDEKGNQVDVSHFRLCVTGVVVELNT